MLANRKLYVVKYMLFSTDNRSGAKKNSFINDGRRYYPIVVPNTVRTGNVKAQKFIESMVKVKVNRFSDRARFKRMMAIMRTDTRRRTRTSTRNETSELCPKLPEP